MSSDKSRHDKCLFDWGEFTPIKMGKMMEQVDNIEKHVASISKKLTDQNNRIRKVEQRIAGIMAVGGVISVTIGIVLVIIKMAQGGP